MTQVETVHQPRGGTGNHVGSPGKKSQRHIHPVYRKKHTHTDPTKATGDEVRQRRLERFG